MSYFGATYLNVIKALQGKEYDVSDFGSQTDVEAIMTRKENDIAARMPDYISQFVYGGTTSGQGLIKGHIVLPAAADSQSVSEFPLVTGYDEDTLEVYLNWPSYWTDNPSKIYTDYKMDSSYYSVSSGILTFSPVLGLGDNIMCNYETTWSDGIPSLQNMLITLTVEELIAQSYNELTQTLWEQRIADAKQNLLDMSQDKYIPKEIATLLLHQDRKVNETGGNFTFTRV